MVCIFKKVKILLLLVWSVPSLAEVQYKPLFSTERNNFYFGGVLNDNLTNKENLFVGSSLKYDLFILEINNIVAKPYRDFFKFSLGMGGHFLDETYKGFQCESSNFPETFIYHGGLKGTLTYFEILVPFFEFGLSRTACFNSEQGKRDVNWASNIDLKYHMSFGFFLSFKILDKMAIYSLDRDYGINDIGLVGQCSWFYKEEVAKIKRDRELTFCEVGLSFKL